MDWPGIGRPSSDFSPFSMRWLIFASSLSMLSKLFSFLASSLSVSEKERSMSSLSEPSE